MTTGGAIEEASRRMVAAGVRSPVADATTLAAHAWRTAPDRISGFLDRPVPGGYWDLVDRRVAREPVERITGIAVFHGRYFAVTDDVFVPRPETEELAGQALDYLASLGADAPCVVDLCTGSGVLAITIASKCRGARVYGADLSSSACEVARRNAGGLDVRFECADVDVAFPWLDGRVDVVVANPPYIPTGGQIRDPEVRDYDPGLALWAGPDGMDVIRSVERAARRLLVPGGSVFVEHGVGQVEEIIRLFTEAGCWTDMTDRPTADDGVLAARRGPANPSDPRWTGRMACLPLS